MAFFSSFLFASSTFFSKCFRLYTKILCLLFDTPAIYLNIRRTRVCECAELPTNERVKWKCIAAHICMSYICVTHATCLPNLCWIRCSSSFYVFWKIWFSFRIWETTERHTHTHACMLAREKKHMAKNSIKLLLECMHTWAAERVRFKRSDARTNVRKFYNIFGICASCRT